MKVEKLIWYKNRLASMSPMEIIHRIFELIKIKKSKFYPKKFNQNINKFPFPVPEFKEKIKLLLDDNLLNSWKIKYNSIKNDEFEALGIKWQISGSDKWYYDPITGNLWDKKYCFDISYRHNDKLGDVKLIWEINRLQYLQEIAAFAVCGNSDEAKEFCVRELIDWIDNNPPFNSIAWASGIELALRVFSILVVLSLLGEASFTKEQKEKINNCLDAHGYWLYRYPSLYSSAGNHLVAEAGGLYLLGLLAPYLPNAGKYKEYGYKTLCREIMLQIYDDGVGAEQTPTYTAFSLEWFIICVKIGEEMGQSFPKEYWDRIEKCKEYLEWFTDEAGNTFKIGDNDEGEVFAPSGNYIASLLGKEKHLRAGIIN